MCQKTRISTFVVLTGNGEIDIRGFESSLRGARYGNTISAVLPGKVADTFLDSSYYLALRDDYAPVDNLIAPVFETRFGYNRKDRQLIYFLKSAGPLPAPEAI